MNHADLLGQIKSPTLVISGERDVATPWTGHGEILARGRLRCCSFKTITWSSRSRRQLPTQRSATPFYHGLRNAVRIGWLPKPVTAAIRSELCVAIAQKKSVRRDVRPRLPQLLDDAESVGISATLKRRIF